MALIADENGCDLLRNSYLWKVINNLHELSFVAWRVVICLEILTFERWLTTIVVFDWHGNGCDLLRNSYLWKVINNAWVRPFAFRVVVICLEILTFERWLTTVAITSAILACCDLLRNSYLWKVINNSEATEVELVIVVICLEILTFERWLTTHHSPTYHRQWLWFA